jgi:hypothetical protein
VSQFATVAAAAVETLLVVFADDGTFTAPPADPVVCRIIKSRQDDVVSFGGLTTDVRAPGWRMDVPQADVPTRPRVGVDTVTLDGTTYAIRDVAEDVEQQIWVLDTIET